MALTPNSKIYFFFNIFNNKSENLLKVFIFSEIKLCLLLCIERHETANQTSYQLGQSKLPHVEL